jgi:hypothetical protein
MTYAEQFFSHLLSKSGSESEHNGKANIGPSTCRTQRTCAIHPLPNHCRKWQPAEGSILLSLALRHAALSKGAIRARESFGRFIVGRHRMTSHCTISDVPQIGDHNELHESPSTAQLADHTRGRGGCLAICQGTTLSRGLPGFCQGSTLSTAGRAGYAWAAGSIVAGR